MLKAQQRLLDLLDDKGRAQAASALFTDIRVITALLCASWPLGRELIDPRLAEAADGHARGFGTGRLVDRPPRDAPAAAGLLTAAIQLLDSPDLAGEVTRHAKAAGSEGPARDQWARVFVRHRSACSPELREFGEQASCGFRKTTAGRNVRRAPSRAGGYRPEHIPALLKQDWYDRHLAPLSFQPAVEMRRAASLTLVQWVSGGSVRAASDYLDVGPRMLLAINRLRTWRLQHADELAAALRNLAADLDADAGLVDYRHRRQAMRKWSMNPHDWQEINDRLPRVRGRRMKVNDRTRQDASVFVWVRVTLGEARFAPRPVEAAQPEPVRKLWRTTRVQTGAKIASPPSPRWASLQMLLNQYADRLAADIDNSPAR